MKIKSLIYRLFCLSLTGFIVMVVLNNYGVPGPNFRSAQFVSEDLVPIISKVPFGAINSAPHTQVLFRDEVIGAASVSVSPEGRIYAADLRGRVWRSTDNGEGVTVLAQVGGRPQGMVMDRNGDFFITIPGWGLVKVSQDPTVLPSIVAPAVDTSGEGDFLVPLAHARGICASSNGTLYLVDADGYPPFGPQNSWGVWDVQGAAWHAGFTASQLGRVIQFDPATGKSKVLGSKLWFASGVALSPNEDFLLVSEAFGLGYWTWPWPYPSVKFFERPTGPACTACGSRVDDSERRSEGSAQAGSMKVFTSSLPGFPGGISPSSDGNFWVAITHVPKDTRWPSFLAKHRFWRQLMGRLYFSMSYVQKMTFIHKHMPPQSLILKISSKTGAIMETLADPNGDAIFDILTVKEHAGKLYVGTAAMQGVPVIDLASAGVLKTSLAK